MKGLFVKGTCLMCLLGLIFICGCATRLADLTIASTRNVALDEVDLDSLPQTQGVVGEDSSFVFLFIPFGIYNKSDVIKPKGDFFPSGVNETWVGLNSASGANRV